MTQHNENGTPDIATVVLARIKSGEVSMRPKAYFVLQTVGLITLAGAVVVLTTFLVNFILFTLAVQGHGALLGFGPHGVETFFFVFPWGWFFLDVALIILTTFLVRRFRFGYRRSVLYVAGGLLLIALLAGIVLEEGTPLNDFLLDTADHDALPPPFGSLYEGVHDGPPHELGVFRGIVSSVGTSTFTMSHDDFDRDGDDGTFTVIPPAGFDVTTLAPGDRIYVAGTTTPGGIAAYGVELIPASPGHH